MTILLIIVFIMLLLNPNLVANEVMDSCKLWYSVLVPTMYPSFVVLDFLFEMPLLNRLANLLYKPFKFIFNIHYPKSTFLIIFSILCGAPASTKLIFSAYQKEEISAKECESLSLCFATLSLPYTLILLKRFMISIFIYYLFFLIIACLLMHIINRENKSFKKKKEDIKKDYLLLFYSSIKNNINVLINILGIVIFFRVIISIFSIKNTFLYPYLEILGGISNQKNSGIVLSAMGFLGISVHLQILSINNEINYLKLFLFRSVFLLLGLLAMF